MSSLDGGTTPIIRKIGEVDIDDVTESSASSETEASGSTETSVSGATDSSSPFGSSSEFASTEVSDGSTKWGTTDSELICRLVLRVFGACYNFFWIKLKGLGLSIYFCNFSVSEIWGSSASSIQLAITKEQKLKKCKAKKKPACKTTEFGCCSDGKTAAKGPFNKGCPQPMTCEESKYGCCPDGVSPAKGKKNKGCPPSKCKESLFGCCPDGVNAAEGNDYEGCPEDIIAVSCEKSQ